MKKTIVTIGGATEDITFFTSDGVLIKNEKDQADSKLMAFEYGQKMKIDCAYSNFGGGAANAAVNFSKLGFNTYALVAVGNDDRGKKIIKNFKANNVKVKLVQKNKTKETGFSFFLVGLDKEHVCFSNRAANQDLAITNYELRIMNKADWVYLTSLSGKWEDILDSVFKVKNAKIAWNPGHIQIKSSFKKISKYIKKTSVLCVNRSEAVKLVLSAAKKKIDISKTEEILKELKGLGSQIVVVTNGKYGADAYDGQKFYHQKVFKEKKREDTTGVGDAFNSSFVAGLELYNNNIAKALELGARVAASVIGLQGAQNGLLNIKDIKI